MGISQSSKTTEIYPKVKEDHPDMIQERIHLIWVYKPNGLSTNVLRVVCEYLAWASLVVHFRNNQIRCFDVVQEKWEPLYDLSADLSKDYDVCYTLTVCGSWKFLICGGLTKKTAAHLIEDGKVTKLPNLKRGRFSHGAVYIYRFHRAYLFGGVDSRCISSCERLDLQSQSWQEVASMHKQRADINPLLYGNLVYVVGGDRMCTIELYDWKKDCFTLLPPLKVPRAVNVLSVLTGDSLLCMSEYFNYRVNLLNGLVSDIYNRGIGKFGRAVTMMKLGKVVIFADEFRCTSHSLVDGRKVKVVEDV